jgi:hypothetical protein
MTQPSHADLNATLHEVLVKLGAVDAKVEANGVRTKEGFDAVDKRLSAIEARVMAYDLLKQRVLGILSASAIAIAGAWYWLHDKIETALGK